MSMNLSEKTVNLRQTPTNISYMCMSNDGFGNPDGGMEGVRRRYLWWCRYCSQNEHNSCRDGVEAQRMITESWDDHIAEVEAIETPRFCVS